MTGEPKVHDAAVLRILTRSYSVLTYAMANPAGHLRAENEMRAVSKTSFSVALDGRRGIQAAKWGRVGACARESQRCRTCCARYRGSESRSPPTALATP